jgi:hypothetical protein
MLLGLASARAGHAQSVDVGIGAVIPIGSTADLVNPGYSAQLSFAIRPDWTRNHLRLEAAVHSLSPKTAGAAKREFVSATANLILVGSDRAPSGYVIIGGGNYQSSGGIARRNDPGFNVGAGIRFSMGFFGTFAEARLHYVADAAKTKFFPMSFGVSF